MLSDVLISLMNKKELEQTSTSSRTAKELLPPPPLDEDAAVISFQFDGSYTTTQLEKHLSDDRAGKGNFSTQGYGYLKNRSVEAQSLLQNINPEVSEMYSGLMTLGSDYSRRARMVEASHLTATTFGRLMQAQDLKKKVY